MRTNIFRPIGGSHGFSMMELLVVLVLIGIGLSLAAPSMDRYVEDYRTRGALDRLSGDVSYARLLAIRQGTRSAIRIQSNGTYRIESSTGGSWTTVQSVDLQDDYRGVSLVGEGLDLEFSSRGLITNLNSNAVLRVSSGSARDSLFVSPAGRIYRAY